ncbi:hypothetical protein J11TS1_13550 [Oceanobacillus sp. J11TS1]|nr:hypothetical protein J11TS1_13550 [Oceanobacillus sp. J11TS1]
MFPVLSFLGILYSTPKIPSIEGCDFLEAIKSHPITPLKNRNVTLYSDTIFIKFNYF